MNEHKFFTPGRVNLIGEHIDYNGGYVLPYTLEMGTTAVLKTRPDHKYSFTSANMPGNVVEIAPEGVQYDPAHDWANYPMGVLRLMMDDGHCIPGFDIHFDGNIPNGTGLSSSASIEVVTARALNEVFALGYTMLDLVKLAQRAENQFCGVNCGIMDQFAVGMGLPGHAIYLNCDTLDYQHVPMHLGNYVLLVMNTNKPRALATSKYNERRAECDAALKAINEAIASGNTDITPPLTHLAHLTPEQFAALAHHITDKTIRARAHHVVHENYRVKQAITALEAGDMNKLGVLLVASHDSLRADYEVTGTELDTLVAEALEHPACAGARMTGAGFGGCAIALVEKSGVEDFARAMVAGYEQMIGYAPTIYR
ncbi:MAG: galactokinase [Defluviitaleaceae bacterium]|nr:galactokinase [Defluviitaleaceae bacterium]